MAFRAGFEPATYGLEIRCSIQLSYQNACAIDNGCFGAALKIQDMPCKVKFPKALISAFFQIPFGQNGQ